MVVTVTVLAGIPFHCLFIAEISSGLTVSEYVLAVLEIKLTFAIIGLCEQQMTLESTKAMKRCVI